jgi:hypothetical protein
MSVYEPDEYDPDAVLSDDEAAEIKAQKDDEDREDDVQSFLDDIRNQEEEFN